MNIKAHLLGIELCAMLLVTGCTQGGDTPPANPDDLDGDGIPNSLESTNDTDGDGLADYLDPDSDGDLLPDGVEDANHNGMVDVNESSPVLSDTDGDGTDDLVETVLQPAGQHWVTNPTQNPVVTGHIFYFVVPYSSNGGKAPVPPSALMGLDTTPGAGVPGSVDIYARASGASVPVDLVSSLLTRIAANPAGGADATLSSPSCTAFGNALKDLYIGPKALAGPDGIAEAIGGIAPGAVYGFTIVPKPNTAIPQTGNAQIFTVNVNVLGNSAGTDYPLGATRTITFIVPPLSP